MSPELTNHPLIRADGSATFSSGLFTILAAVNGPVEVLRRDELPEEAAVEINVRPSSGVGGPRERWLERAIASLLRTLLLVHMHPRTLIQVTLQVTKEPSLNIKKAVADITLIPALANAAFLALVDGALPLERSMVAGLGVVTREGALVLDPTEHELVGCRSVHAIAYGARGDILLNESAGQFDMAQWQEIAGGLKEVAVVATAPASEDKPMVNGALEAVPWMRQILEGSVQLAGSWREGG